MFSFWTGFPPREIYSSLDGLERSVVLASEGNVQWAIENLLRDQFDEYTGEITPESSLVNDFLADSLDIINTLLYLEHVFGVDFTDEAQTHLVEKGLVGSILSMVEAKLYTLKNQAVIV